MCPLGVEGANVPAGLEIHTGAGTRIGIYPKPDHTPATFPAGRAVLGRAPVGRRAARGGPVDLVAVRLLGLRGAFWSSQAVSRT